MLTDRMGAPPITYSEIHRAVDSMVAAVLQEHRSGQVGIDGYPFVTGTLMAMLTQAVSLLDESSKRLVLESIMQRQLESEQAYLIKQLSQKS